MRFELDHTTEVVGSSFFVVVSSGRVMKVMKSMCGIIVNY